MIHMIGIGCDHGGFELKEYVKKHLEEKGLEVRDFGSYTPERCDYPVVAEAVARALDSAETVWLSIEQTADAQRGVVTATAEFGATMALGDFPEDPEVPEHPGE
jgi:ribose 5-phosphate isomerase RpiB